MSKPIVHRFLDAESVAKNAAHDFLVHMAALLQSKPEVHVMLTGGTVGIATLAAIADDELSASLDFTKLHFWWGDERFVASDSDDRNSLQAYKALLRKIDVDSTKVHEFPATDNGLMLDDAAEQFEATVRAINPHFDIAFVGMGPDGHICSLFPGKPTPPAGRLIVAEHDSPKPPPQRLSFTYEAMNAIDQIWFIVAGADKQDAVSVAMGDSPTDLPVGRVSGAKATHWYIDSTAGTTVFGC
ncbi:6-phosphogluconolactonase [Rhodoluna sp.]|uniref:6-phosphogluconolactonase n=1 Tax=Rhodoluna sp. TaxID=1969481 RepID=UPI0025E9A5DC|nr:6-phosphogluconolactonase [Rhodoluna sp.]